jgi:hypothetical protein
MKRLNPSARGAEKRRSEYMYFAAKACLELPGETYCSPGIPSEAQVSRRNMQARFAKGRNWLAKRGGDELEAILEGRSMDIPTRPRTSRPSVPMTATNRRCVLCWAAWPWQADCHDTLMQPSVCHAAHAALHRSASAPHLALNQSSTAWALAIKTNLPYWARFAGELAAMQAPRENVLERP